MTMQYSASGRGTARWQGGQRVHHGGWRGGTSGSACRYWHCWCNGSQCHSLSHHRRLRCQSCLRPRCHRHSARHRHLQLLWQLPVPGIRHPRSPAKLLLPTRHPPHRSCRCVSRLRSTCHRRSTTSGVHRRPAFAVRDACCMTLTGSYCLARWLALPSARLFPVCFPRCKI